MPMSVEYAFELQALRQKLAALRDATNDIEPKHAIQKELDKIEPYLDDAIADIGKISSAISTAATIINTIVGVIGPALGV
jgi:phage-related protein